MADRKSAVLTSSSLACLSNIATVNLTAGCAHGCLYCYTRGYSTYPGQNKVVVYQNTLDKLREELPRKRRRPKAVYFSPSSDLFQPVPAVLDLAYAILEFLFAAKVGVAFVTKGRVPERHMSLLLANAAMVRAQVGLTTLDDEFLGVFEPSAAPAKVRLAQVESLIAAGIPAEVRVDPIVPAFTDDEPTFNSLCSKVAGLGIKDIAASVLFLRPAVTQSLKRNLEDQGVLTALLQRFSGASQLAIHAEKSRVFSLSAADRRDIYERLERIAGHYGIQVHICACKNPDLAKGSCNIAGRWPCTESGIQQNLFD